jgi:hypothetical protein
MNFDEQIRAHLTFIYGAETASLIFPQLKVRLDDFRHSFG